MILYLTHGNGEESIPLELPAASSQVEEIDIRLDDICSGEGNFRISDVKSSVKGLWQFIRSADLLDPENLEKLNQLSRQLDAMSEKERQIFAGALLSKCINSLDDVLQTAGRIGQYEIITEVTCDRELGWYLVEHGKIDCPEHLKPYLDYVGIGAEFYSNCGGAYCPTTTVPLSASSIRIGTFHLSSAAIRSLRKRARPLANSSSPTTIPAPT